MVLYEDRESINRLLVKTIHIHVLKYIVSSITIHGHELSFVTINAPDPFQLNAVYSSKH